MYDSKVIGYFTEPRIDLIQLLSKTQEKKNIKLLELGAGTGETLLAAKKLGIASECVGIELMQFDNSNQSSPEIDRFILGDIQTLSLDLSESYFDVIICADVLEHLVDPWQVIQKLSKHLKKDGLFIASIPNFRNYRVLRSIIFQGDFAYQEGGILDRTHLRFFCKSNIVDMFQGCGYEIEAIETNMGGYGLKHKLFNNLTLKLLRDFFVFQYLRVAKNSGYKLL